MAVDEVADQLLEQVKQAYTASGKLSDESLSLLNFIYQGPLLTALELVEKRSVTRVISPSGRELFQVIGASGTPYTCFPNLKYCSCPAFHFSDHSSNVCTNYNQQITAVMSTHLLFVSVLCRGDHLMCKHVLAMKLSEILGLTKILHVSNDEITNMIMSVE
ncbi:unnamed protein product [Candidula unifasciata]|uniref:SWIM-type domain-containing protein n=1 Tax=Candidula unifasciata TaxID=100452 RepID=A0A8S3Z611_9EUPU|nr:unnamed protein product [Candidula unifasciata]